MAGAWLDHAGVVGGDLPGLAGAYEALGFTLTPVARQSGRLEAGGAVVPWGTANRCAMLRDGYLELLGIVDPALPANGLDRLLARHAGLHVLALGVGDEEAALARLRRAGVDVPGVMHLERPVDSADPRGAWARFARLPLADAPEGRVQLIRHLTPGAIWQERFMGHRNRAVGLEAVVMVVASAAETAARVGRLAGVPVVPDLAGGYAVALSRGVVRVLEVGGLERVLPGVGVPGGVGGLPFMAGGVVRTEDGGEAARGVAARGGVALEAVPGGWMAMAGGAAVVFA